MDAQQLREQKELQHANYINVMARTLGRTPHRARAAGDLPGVALTRAGKRGLAYETQQRLARPRAAPRPANLVKHTPLSKSLRPCTVLVTLAVATLVIASSVVVTALHVGGFLPLV